MNWGYKILITFIIFAIAMLSMVYVATQQTNEMQEDNYYAKELVYQTVIDGKNNLQKTGPITLTNTPNGVQIQAPAKAVDTIADGKIHFLCPSDEKNDLHIAFSPNANGQQLVHKAQLKNVLYTVRISWKKGNAPYYFEQSFIVE